MYARRRGVLSTFLLACAALLLGCATRPVPVDTGHLLFWEVARAGDTEPAAWLLGTLHMGRDAFDFDPTIGEALARADVLVLEVAPEELTPEHMATLMAERAFFQDGTRLRDVLEPETVALLDAWVVASGIDPITIAAVRPWALLVQLQAQQLLSHGFAAEHGVERSLTRDAPAKPTVGLETLEEQLDTLAAIPLASVEPMLREFFEQRGEHSPEAVAADLEQLLLAWEGGDIAWLEDGLLHEDEGYTALLIHRRNDRMVERLGALLSESELLFVAVGAAHMVGESGLPSRLAAEGYRVRRLPRTP